MTHKITLDEIKKKIKLFVQARDWEKFHSPKNISMSIAIEAAELMEHFQWLTVEQSKKMLKDKNRREEIEDELADIAIYVLDFCNVSGVNIDKAILRKLEKSSKKYPVHLVKGKADKYTHYKE